MPGAAGRLWGDLALRNTSFLGVAGMFKGTRALSKATDSLLESGEASVDEVVTTMLDNADTLILFRSYGRAFDRYAETFEYLSAQDPGRIDEFFGRPVALFSPHPGNTRKSSPDNFSIPARIEFSVTVDRKGAVRNIETVHVEPPEVPIYRYRKAARNARYRPAIADGEPVAAQDVKVSFAFKYFPG